MCKVTVSLLELFRRFPDGGSARIHFENRRWANGVYCPHCEEKERITKRKNGYYRWDRLLAHSKQHKHGQAIVQFTIWLSIVYHICFSVYYTLP